MRPVWLLGCLLACNSENDSVSAPLFLASGESYTHQSINVDAQQRIVWSDQETLYRSTDDAGVEVISGEGLAPGIRRFIATTSEHLFVYVHGRGLYRGSLNGGDFVSVEAGLENPLLGVLNDDASPVPLAMREAGDTLWMAAAGGLFSSQDAGDTWTLAATGGSGAVNLLFSDVEVVGQTVVAGAILPASLIPKDFEGFLKGTVFRSDDGGQNWAEWSGDLPSELVSAVAYHQEQWFVGTLDQGVFVLDGVNWLPVAGSPSDVVALESDGQSLQVGSSSRGVWQRVDEVWHQVGSAATRDVRNGVAVLADGTVLRLTGETVNEPPASAGGNVHIALSFHANYYHSYRGDSPTDDGFGKDIDVIRNTLDWLDAYPEVHGDWDSDNVFTTDDWMVEYSPDILERIEARVASGQDQVRLMSWNNGAMASMTREEFDVGVERAKTSNADAFGAWVPGVQPQENMFTPDHIGWYLDHGIDWITLFYSANGFTAGRLDVELSGASLYNPVNIEGPDGSTMKWVPVYHHADMMEHGGLAGWAQQIHDTITGDSLLVIHFDADSESWENFASELEATKDLDFVTFTNIGTYVDSHEALETVILPGDVADGTGDGFQSWAEKDWNHRLYTEVVRARKDAHLARVLAPADGEVQSAVAAALEPRLLALSTTNYGLAMPTLHEDRVASGAQQAADAVRLSAEALALAEDLHPVGAGKLELINTRNAAGPAMMEFELTLPDWKDDAGLRIRNEDGDLVSTELVDTDGTTITVRVVADVAAYESQTWTWSYSPDESVNPAGTLSVDDAPELAELRPAFVDVLGVRSTGALAETSTAVEAQGRSAYRSQIYAVPFVQRTANVEHIQRKVDGLPGTIVEVQGVLPDLGLNIGLESVVLSPLVCDALATELTWKTFADTIRTRPVRTPVATWNGQSADGWTRVTCDGRDLSISHRVTERTSLAFMPIAAEGGQTLMAPLGTLYGPSPWHDGRRTGGHGIGELVTSVVGSQFAPAAPDWSGQTVTYRLLVGDDLSTDVLELFAHPPRVRVGARR